MKKASYCIAAVSILLFFSCSTYEEKYFEVAGIRIKLPSTDSTKVVSDPASGLIQTKASGIAAGIAWFQDTDDDPKQLKTMFITIFNKILPLQFPGVSIRKIREEKGHSVAGHPAYWNVFRASDDNYINGVYWYCKKSGRFFILLAIGSEKRARRIMGDAIASCNCHYRPVKTAVSRLPDFDCRKDYKRVQNTTLLRAYTSDHAYVILYRTAGTFKAEKFTDAAIKGVWRFLSEQIGYKYLVFRGITREELTGRKVVIIKGSAMDSGTTIHQAMCVWTAESSLYYCLIIAAEPVSDLLIQDVFSRIKKAKRK